MSDHGSRWLNASHSMMNRYDGHAVWLMLSERTPATPAATPITAPEPPPITATATKPAATPVLVENSTIAVDLVFHAGCWYSLMSPASLGRSWIRSVLPGKGSTSGSSFGARRAMP
jgi:hypothetical protein